MLPADASFDAVVSTFGVMFSPDQDRAAGEMVRVCRSGGRIGLPKRTSEGFIGQMFKTIGKYLPPPTGARSPAVWGTREWLQTTFGAAAYAVTAEPRHFTFRYRSAQHFLDIFGTCYGRMLKAFEMLEEAGGTKRSHATSSTWSDPSTPRMTRPWSFAANTSRLPSDESPRGGRGRKGTP